MSANFAGDSKKSDEVDHSTLQVVVADPLTSGFNNGNDGTSMEKSSKWVKFEEDDEDKFKNVSLHDDSRINKDTSSSNDGPPVLDASETVHVTIDNKQTSTPKHQMQHKSSLNNTSSISKTSQAAVIEIQTNEQNPTTPALRTIELSSGRVREGFANGEIIVTLQPVNVNWAWITPAVFRPELVPEELMAQGLTLTVEEYVHAMEVLVNDYRFTLYNICYKRVLVCWIILAFCVLMGLLFSGLTGITLFSLGVGWLFLNAGAIFLCMFVKLRLARGLERCLARVNKLLLKHKILLALDDRGNISCHKVHLIFMYFDSSKCRDYLHLYLERSEQNGNTVQPGWESRMDVDNNDIVIQGANTTRVSRKQALAEEFYLRYLQRWGKDFLRHRLDWILEENGREVISQPRHLQTAYCPCQYAEEVLMNKKPKDGSEKSCCTSFQERLRRYGFSL